MDAVAAVVVVAAAAVLIFVVVVVVVVVERREIERYCADIGSALLWANLIGAPRK